MMLTYIMLGWGLNIVVGLAGLLDLGYVAFYAVGAYSYALIAQRSVGLSGFVYLLLEYLQLFLEFFRFSGFKIKRRLSCDCYVRFWRNYKDYFN